MCACNRRADSLSTNTFPLLGLMNGRLFLAKLFSGLALYFLLQEIGAFAQANVPSSSSVVVTVIEGTVEVAPAGTDNWAPASLNQKLKTGDKLRTGKLSRTVLRS